MRGPALGSMARRRSSCYSARMSTVKVKVDTGLCIGAANCVGVSADFFRLNEENIAIIRQGVGTDFEKTIDVNPEQLALLQEAAESCPTLAIQITNL